MGNISSSNEGEKDEEDVNDDISSMGIFSKSKLSITNVLCNVIMIEH